MHGTFGKAAAAGGSPSLSLLPSRPRCCPVLRPHEFNVIVFLTPRLSVSISRVFSALSVQFALRGGSSHRASMLERGDGQIHGHTCGEPEQVLKHCVELSGQHARRQRQRQRTGERADTAVCAGIARLLCVGHSAKRRWLEALLVCGFFRFWLCSVLAASLPASDRLLYSACRTGLRR